MRAFLQVVRFTFVTTCSVVGLVVFGDIGAAFAVATFARVPHVPIASPIGDDATLPTLVVFGDSLGVGFRATSGHGWMDLLRDRLATRDARSAVLNESVDGSRIVDLRDQVANGGSRGSARAVLVVAGGNDLMDATDPYSLARADVALLRDIRARYPSARIIVTNIPDISWRAFHIQREGPARPLPLPFRVGLSWLTNVDNAIVDRVALRSGAEILDLHRLTLDGDDRMPGLAKISLHEFAQRYVSFDGLHPNDRGYAMLADFAWPSVARAMRVGR